MCLHVHPLLGRLRRRRPSSTSHTLFESEVAFTFPKCIAVALKLWLQASSALRQDGMLRFVPTSLDMKTGTRTLCACCFMFHLVELVTPQHDACFLMLACAMVVNSPSWHFTCSPRHRALPGSGLQAPVTVQVVEHDMHQITLVVYKHRCSHPIVVGPAVLLGLSRLARNPQVAEGVLFLLLSCISSKDLRCKLQRCFETAASICLCCCHLELW